jgi:hypothetical protein
MPARVDIPLPLACGAPAFECGNPPPGCAAAREPPPPPECAAALPPPPDFCLPAEAISGAINISETQIQMNALMNSTSTSFYGNGETKFRLIAGSLAVHKKWYALASLNHGSTQIFFAKAVI